MSRHEPEKGMNLNSMKYKQNILIFLIWIISITKAAPDYRYISKPQENFEPHYSSWSYGFYTPHVQSFPQNFGKFPFHNQFQQQSHQYAEINSYYPNQNYDSSSSSEEDDDCDDSSEHEEILVDSMNNAYHKLNKIFPSKPNNVETPNWYPSTPSPEVISESIEKAVESLQQVFSKPNEQKPETFVQSSDLFTAHTFHLPPTVKQQVSLSLSEALEQLEKLFLRLPDELKLKPNNNNKPGNFFIQKEQNFTFNTHHVSGHPFHPFLFPATYLPPIGKPTTQKPFVQATTKTTTTTAAPDEFFTSPELLFTSSVKEPDQPSTPEVIITTTERPKEVVDLLFTSSVNIPTPTTANIADEETETTLFTSSPEANTTPGNEANVNMLMMPSTSGPNEQNEGMLFISSNTTGSNEENGGNGSVLFVSSSNTTRQPEEENDGMLFISTNTEDIPTLDQIIPNMLFTSSNTTTTQNEENEGTLFVSSNTSEESLSDGNQLFVSSNTTPNPSDGGLLFVSSNATETPEIKLPDGSQLFVSSSNETNDGMLFVSSNTTETPEVNQPDGNILFVSSSNTTVSPNETNDGMLFVSSNTTETPEVNQPDGNILFVSSSNTTVTPNEINDGMLFVSSNTTETPEVNLPDGTQLFTSLNNGQSPNETNDGMLFVSSNTTETPEVKLPDGTQLFTSSNNGQGPNETNDGMLFVSSNTTETPEIKLPDGTQLFTSSNDGIGPNETNDGMLFVSSNKTETPEENQPGGNILFVSSSNTTVSPNETNDGMLFLSSNTTETPEENPPDGTQLFVSSNNGNGNETNDGMLFVSSNTTQTPEVNLPDGTQLFVSSNNGTSSNETNEGMLFVSSNTTEMPEQNQPDGNVLFVSSSNSTISQNGENGSMLFVSSNTTGTPAPETGNMLFTSSPDESMLFTSAPENNVSISRPIATAIDENGNGNMLFTSSPQDSSNGLQPLATGIRDNNNNKNVLFTSSPVESNNNLFTSAPQIESTTSRDLRSISSFESRVKDSKKITNFQPVLDLRSKEDLIVFPDEFEEIQNKYQEYNPLPSRFGNQTPSSGPSSVNQQQSPDKNQQVNNNKPIILEYQPNRPTFHQEPLFYPMPIIRPDANVNSETPDRNNIPVTTTLTTTQRTIPKPVQTGPINLEYQPNRPTFQQEPLFYPMPIIRPDSNVNSEIPDRNNIPITTTTERTIPRPVQTGPINLEYQPNRPTFQQEPLFYPMPIIRPDSNVNPEIPDRNNIPVTTTSTTTQRIIPRPVQTGPISLEYQPSRPPFAPNPIVYPMPISRPDFSSNPEIPDRNNIPITTTTKTTTQRIIPRPVQTGPINLEYQPSRPPFAPNPIVYPMPINRPDSTSNPEIPDRNNIPITTTTTTAKTTEYRPNIDQQLTDRNPVTPPPKQTNTNKPIILGYQPIRPSYLPEPLVYPMPIYRPGANPEIPDRNNIPITTTTTTQRIIPRPVPTGPISLEYKPSRPPFAPNPIVYPRPISRPSSRAYKFGSKSKVPAYRVDKNKSFPHKPYFEPYTWILRRPINYASE